MTKKTISHSDQSSRFIEAARATGASEDEAVFDANLKKIAKAKVGETASQPTPIARAKSDPI